MLNRNGGGRRQLPSASSIACSEQEFDSLEEELNADESKQDEKLKLKLAYLQTKIDAISKSPVRRQLDTPPRTFEDLPRPPSTSTATTTSTASSCFGFDLRKNFDDYGSVFGKTDVNSGLLLAFYFILGAYLATPALAINYFSMRVLRIGPTSFGILYGLVASPWFFKPVFGLISDQRPIHGLHRLPYLLVCSFGATLTWIALYFPGVHSTTSIGFGILMILTNVFICFADVVVDCIMIRTAKLEDSANEGKMQTRVQFMRNCGSMLGIVFGARLVLWFDNMQVIFAITAVFPMLLFIGSLFLRDIRDDKFKVSSEESKSVCEHIRLAWKRTYEDQTLVNVAKFLFILTATPNSGVTFRYYLINQLKFSQEFMGYLSIASVVAALVGLALYNNGGNQYPTRTITKLGIVGSTIISAIPMILVTGLNQRLRLSNSYFVVGDDVAESFSGQFLMMPIYVTVKNICPDGSEGLVYAGFMSINNIGGAVSTWIAAFITKALGITSTNFDNLWILTLICVVTGFAPFFFVHWLPEKSEIKAKQLIATPSSHIPVVVDVMKTKSRTAY